MRPANYRDLESGLEIYELLPDNRMLLIVPQLGEKYETSLGDTYLFGWTYQNEPGYGRGHLVMDHVQSAEEYRLVYKVSPRLFVKQE
jgi:hypothetical protein